MNNKNRDGLSLLAFATALTGDTTEIFCRMLADKTMFHYAGKEDDKYKFYDVINEKEMLLTKEEVLSNL